MSSGGVTERLPRLLSLVPYLLARPGIPVADAAADFGITEKQLRRDLELLWMCGLPGYGPGDLIDLSFSGDTVTVTHDAGMRRPLRLTTAEATALLVALRTLADVPGVVDTETHIAYRAYSRHDLESAFAVGVETDARRRVLVEPGGEADVLEADGPADAAPQIRRLARGRGLPRERRPDRQVGERLVRQQRQQTSCGCGSAEALPRR